jgi:hypothetical protein
VIQALASHQVRGGEEPQSLDPHAHADAKAQHGDAKAHDHGKPENALLAQFHYLSTVSGGGYIGSWLSAWRRRVSFRRVWENLVDRPCGPDVEPGTIGWLRSYSNYLTPKLGALSGDFWAALAICLRNVVLNWLVIIPLLCIVLLIIKLIAVFAIGVAHHAPTWSVIAIFGILGAVLLVFALSRVTRYRPTRRLPQDPGITQTCFLWMILLPAGLAASMFIQLGASNSGLWLVNHHGKTLVFIVAAAPTVSTRRRWKASRCSTTFCFR